MINMKAIVPKFVADYIEKYIRLDFSLVEWFNFDHVLDECERKTKQWLYGVSHEERTKREYLLVKAIRFGYEVEVNGNDKTN